MTTFLPLQMSLNLNWQEHQPLIYQASVMNLGIRPSCMGFSIWSYIKTSPINISKTCNNVTKPPFSQHHHNVMTLSQWENIVTTLSQYFDSVITLSQQCHKCLVFAGKDLVVQNRGWLLPKIRPYLNVCCYSNMNNSGLCNYVLSWDLNGKGEACLRLFFYNERTNGY